MWQFKKRWNVETFSAKLHAFVKVLTPQKVKTEIEIGVALTRWEAEVVVLIGAEWNLVVLGGLS